MSFLKFILKNPFRRKTSAILSIVGSAIGIIVIVALGGITDGLVNTFEDTIHAGGADFQISGKETGDSAYGTNTIDANWTDKIANVSGVEEAYPIYVVLTSVGDDYMNTLIGIDPNGTTLADISMKEGRIFEDNASEAILGEIYADDNNYSVGDNIEIDGEDFEVVGIYETGVDIDNALLVSRNLGRIGQSVAVTLTIDLFLMQGVVGGVAVGGGMQGAGVGVGALVEALQILAAGEGQVSAGAGEGPKGGVPAPGLAEVPDLGHLLGLEVELVLVKGHVSHDQILL